MGFFRLISTLWWNFSKMMKCVNFLPLSVSFCWWFEFFRCLCRFPIFRGPLRPWMEKLRLWKYDFSTADKQILVIQEYAYLTIGFLTKGSDGHWEKLLTIKIFIFTWTPFMMVKFEEIFSTVPGYSFPFLLLKVKFSEFPMAYPDCSIKFFFFKNLSSFFNTLKKSDLRILIDSFFMSLKTVYWSCHCYGNM